MLFSLEWLLKLCPVGESAERVAEALTERGLTVDAVTPAGGDCVLDVDVPANRPDCLGHRGLARELAAAFGVPLADIDCGIVVVRRSLLEEIPLQSRSSFAVVELAAKANFMGHVLDEVALSNNGNWIAVAEDDRLRLYHTNAGLRWSHTGDDLLRYPCFAPDNDRIAVGSEIGTLYVLDVKGRQLVEQDLGSLPVAA